MAFVGVGGKVPAAAAAVRGARCSRRRIGVVNVAEVEVNKAKAAFPEMKEGVEPHKSLTALSERFEVEGVKTPDRATLEWFLADRRYDHEEAFHKICGMLEWREKLEAVGTEELQNEESTGKASFFPKGDLHGRKVLVIRASRHVTNEFPFESSEKLIQHMMDSAVREMPEGTETILAILDMRDFGVKNSDVRLAQLLVDVFFTYYPRRLSELLVVDAPLMFQPMWRAIKPMLKKYSGLVKFVKQKDLPDYFDDDTGREFMRHFRDPMNNDRVHSLEN